MKTRPIIPKFAMTIALMSLTSTLAVGFETADWQRPEVVLPWFNGVINSIGTDIACLSDPPISEIRVQGFAGYSLVPPNRTPAVGEVFYTHIVLSHPGNPCTGSVTDERDEFGLFLQRRAQHVDDAEQRASWLTCGIGQWWQGVEGAKQIRRSINQDEALA